MTFFFSFLKVYFKNKKRATGSREKMITLPSGGFRKAGGYRDLYIYIYISFYRFCSALCF